MRSKLDGHLEGVDATGMFRSSALGTSHYKARGLVGNVFRTAQDKGWLPRTNGILSEFYF